MQWRRNRSSYFFTLTSVAISIIIGAILWFIGEDNIATITLSLVVIVLGLMLDALGRFNEQEEKIANMLNVHHIIQSDALLNTMVSEIVAGYSKSLEWNSELLNARAKNILKKCVEEILHIGSGNFQVLVDEEIQINKEMLLAAQISFKATSYVEVSKWWESEAAQKYLDEHKVRLKKGVIIDRIFLVSGANKLFECKGLIQLQLDMGINCWVVGIKSLIPSLLEDFIITDDKIMSISHLTRDGRPKDVEVSIDPWVVSKYTDKFNALLLLARNAKDVPWDKPVDELEKELF